MAVPARSANTADEALAQAGEVLRGSVRAASRLITSLQAGRSQARDVLRQLHPRCGKAQLIGVTGPPGAGKSTLVGALIRELRNRGLSVGVLAVDPSSPFSGGAVLGDRDRMEGSRPDDEVFIRSLASRGATGGLCVAANDAVDVLDAMGKNVVLIETVGVGQGEIEIARIADCVLLVLVPGYGDSLQAMKAGVLEIADIIVLNKADLEGAEQAAQELAHTGYRQVVPGSAGTTWEVPVLKVVAARGDGASDLVSETLRQFEFASATGWQATRRRERRARQVLEILTQGLRGDLFGAIRSDTRVQALLDRVEAGALDPYSAAEELSEALRSSSG